jgi:hypothetical protein
MALAPTETWTLRNDIYYYGADVDKALYGGRLEVGADLDFLMNFTTLLYKPEVKVWGAQYAWGIFVPLVNAEIEATFALEDFGRKASESDTGLGDIALIPVVLFPVYCHTHR